jgi:hypothetical protein
MKGWKAAADDLKKAGWSCVRADEKLTAFVELESAIYEFVDLIS